MKQYITVDQIDELNEIGAERFKNWRLGERELPNIGELITFLYSHETVIIESEDRESPHIGWIVNKETGAVELCDALWIRVKKILEKK